MILLSDEFAFLTYLSHEGGNIPDEASSEHGSAIGVLTTLRLVRAESGRLVLTEAGRLALAAAEPREGVSIRYFVVPRPGTSRPRTE